MNKGTERYKKKCEMPITTKRLRKLIDDSGKTKLAISYDIDCDVSTVIKHYNGDRSVNSEFIVRYAKYFHVSTDYLLGCENIPNENELINQICDYTGLSLRDVEYLHDEELSKDWHIKEWFAEQSSDRLFALMIKRAVSNIKRRSDES